MRLTKGFYGALLTGVLGWGSAQAATITYADFSSTAGLTLNGNAAQVGNVLRVTPANFNQAGSVFSTSAISLASNVIQYRIPVSFH